MNLIPQSNPLKIAIVGAGRIGSTFAFQLARTGGHDVTVVATPGSERLRQLRRDGGIVDVRGERADVLVADSLDEGVPYDLVVVTLLAHQIDAVLPTLRSSAAKTVLFVSNAPRSGPAVRRPSSASNAGSTSSSPRVCRPSASPS